MGKKILKLFLDTLLRAAVILLALAIVVMLVLLVRTMTKTKDKDETTSSDEIVTEQQDPSDLTFSDGSSEVSDTEVVTDEPTEAVAADSKTANIAVINATGVAGVAGSWQTVLSSDGYSSVDVGNYLGEIQSSTVVYVSGDYTGSDLAAMFSGASTADKSQLDSTLIDVAADSFDIIIVVGTSDSGNN